MSFASILAERGVEVARVCRRTADRKSLRPRGRRLQKEFFSAPRRVASSSLSPADRKAWRQRKAAHRRRSRGRVAAPRTVVHRTASNHEYTGQQRRLLPAADAQPPRKPQSRRGAIPTVRRTGFLAVTLF